MFLLYMSQAQRRAVFLDRDGVINRSTVRDGKPYPPATVAEFEFLPGVDEAVSRLRQAGFVVIVVTNQPDVANGITPRATVDAMNSLVTEKLGVDQVKVCFHTDRDNCECRKPKPGMLLEAAREWNIDLERSFMVGDRWRDIDAGRAARCKTILVGEGYSADKKAAPDLFAASLLAASQIILSLA